MKNNFKNTLYKGTVRYIVFKEDEVWYAVGLEFNIVESGDTPELALHELFEAMNGYIKSAQKVKARPFALNQNPDEEYEQMWGALSTHEKSKSLKHKEVATFGQQLVAV